MPLEKAHNLSIYQDYILHWEPFTAFRQAYQNLRDGVVSSLPQGKTLKDHVDTDYHDRMTDLNLFEYKYILKETQQEIGSLIYNGSTITFKNKGKLTRKCLALGGYQKDHGNKEITGRFGEGLKMGALVMCRANKTYIVQTNKQSWAFSIKKEQDFIEENTLHVTIYKNDDFSDSEIILTIGNVTIDQFQEWRKKILEITDESINKLEPNSDKSLGYIITNKPYERLFVNGIFIQDFSKENTRPLCSYNLLNIELDRDRRSILNKLELQQVTSKLHAKIANEIDQIQGAMTVGYMEMMYKMIQNFQQCDYFVYFIYQNLNKNTFKKIFNLYIQRIKSNKKMPANSASQINQISQKIAKYQLQSSFYEFEPVHWLEYSVLVRAQQFKSFDKVLNQRLLSVPQFTAISDNQKTLIGEVEGILNGIKNKVIKFGFKGFSSENLSYLDQQAVNKLFISKSLLDEQNARKFKMQLFTQAVKLLNLNIYDILQNPPVF